MAFEAQEALKVGDLGQCEKLLMEAVRAKPGAVELRAFLAQLSLIMGRWQRAENQFKLLGELSPEAKQVSDAYRAAAAAEVMRADVFAGKTRPIIFGTPPAWCAQLSEGLRLEADGELAAAAEVRLVALEAADECAGLIDGVPFQWLGDADSRLGPVAEMIVGGIYHWVPFSSIAGISIGPPSDLRDAAWVEAEVEFVNGAAMGVLIASRYPGSENENSLALSRRTEWREMGHGLAAGIGQRILVSDQDEYPFLSVRIIAFDRPESEKQDSGALAAGGDNLG